MATMTTTRGDRFESNFTDAQAIDILAGLTRKSGFVQSLLDEFNSRGLTRNQLVWVHKIAVDNAQPRLEQATAVAEIDLANIEAMLQAASSRLKWPKIRVAAEDGRAICLSPRQNGVVYVTDLTETRFDSYRGCERPVYYGKIERSQFIPPKSGCPEWVVKSVEWFAADPLRAATQYGRLTGHCCFCGRTLTDDDSVTNGYGPVCAVKYGLA